MLLAARAIFHADSDRRAEPRCAQSASPSKKDRQTSRSAFDPELERRALARAACRGVDVQL